MKAPTPVKGWRLFLGEVGVIVLGVLIALGAQQAVHEIQIRSDVKAFRQTIDHEIGLNLFVYDFRSRQTACTSKRIAELRAWLDRARSGATVPAIQPNSPVTFSLYRSAWTTRNGEVFAHLPDKVRQQYAEFYDELDNNNLAFATERDAWDKLAPYTEPGPITLQDRRVIRPALLKAEDRNDVMSGNFKVSQKVAADLRIGIVDPDFADPGFDDQVKAMIAACPSAIAKT